MKIMGNIVGLPSPRSDWNQTDETKADYIKNKPLKEIASIKSLHYYGDRDIVPNVEVTLRTVFDDEGWMIGDVVDIVQLDNYYSYTDTVILPERCRNYFIFEKGKFLKSDGKDADGSKVTKVIIPRLDNDEDPDMCFVDKDTFSSFFPNLETVIVCDNVTKGYVDEKISEVKPTIIKEETDVDVASIIMEDNHVYHTQMVLNKLNVAFPEGLEIGYTSVLYLLTPFEIPNDYTSFPDDVIFKGDSVEDENFVPEANMRYTIVFDYDRIGIIGYVSGVILF